MKSFLRVLITVVLAAHLAAAQTGLRASGATTVGGSERVQKHVAAIAEGADTPARMAAIIKRLDELGIKHRLETFSSGEWQGTNIVAELPNPTAQKGLLLGAHYDRVQRGNGVLDNASGTVAVLELLAALKNSPLKNHGVTAVFFDLEEIGLVGSKKFVQLRTRKTLPSLYVNFDVFGYGDTLWVGAVDANTGPATLVGGAAKAANFPAQIGPAYPPSDHLSFRDVGVDTLSFSLIDGTEIPGILQVFNRERPAAMPRVLTIIHSDSDTIDKYDAKAVTRALPVVEQAIRAIDTKQ